MNDEKLIELVRLYPVLYHLAHPRYMDTEFKNTIWDKIGEEMKTTDKLVQLYQKVCDIFIAFLLLAVRCVSRCVQFVPGMLMWSFLKKDSGLLEGTKMESGALESMKKYSIVKDSDLVATVEILGHMPEKMSDFIKRNSNSEGDSVINRRKNLKRSNSKFKKLDKGNASSSHSINHRKRPWCSHIQFLNNSMTRLANRSATSCHSHSDQTPDALKRTIIDSDMMKQSSESSKRKKLSEEEIYGDGNCPNSPDDIDHLFMSYAATFRRISPRLQAKLKMDLANLFAKAELEDLERGPAVRNIQQ